MDRRAFLRGAVAAAGGTAMLPTAAMAGEAGTAAPGPSPSGSLDGRPADANGLVLPEGFTSRVIAVAGEPVEPTSYEWLVFPDGAATFDDGEGGWWYVCNSEVFAPLELAGVSSIHFDADGQIVAARRILEGSTANCAGGPTPWGTWLSCEERFDEMGQVWECDPTGEEPAVLRPAMGRWAHEAVAVDPESGTLYLTQDHAEGLIYRFTPDSYPDLASGKLEACIVEDDGSVTWRGVSDPSAETTPTREQVPGATVFPGNEGMWYHDGSIVFTTKLDNRVHAIDLREQRYTLIWDGTPQADIAAGLPKREPLAGVDNITVESGSGDLYVAEDGDDMEVVLITTEGQVTPFARIVEDGHDSSEVTGPVFNPAGDRLYFSSQRGPSRRTTGDILEGVPSDVPNGGVTYEVTGPFRGAASEGTTTVPSPATTLEAAQPPGGGSDDSDFPVGLAVGAGAVAVAAAAGGVIWLRSRRAEPGDGTT
jgi:secreted PhoX family phosphatase